MSAHGRDVQMEIRPHLRSYQERAVLRSATVHTQGACWRDEAVWRWRREFSQRRRVGQVPLPQFGAVLPWQLLFPAFCCSLIAS